MKIQWLTCRIDLIDFTTFATNDVAERSGVSRDLSVKRLRSWQLKMTNGSSHPVFRNPPVYTNTPCLLVTQLVHVHYTPLCTKYYVFNTYCTPCLHKQSPCTQTLPSFANVLITPHVHKHPASHGLRLVIQNSLPVHIMNPPPTLHPLAQWSLNITSVGINTSQCELTPSARVQKHPHRCTSTESCTSCTCIKTLPPQVLLTCAQSLSHLIIIIIGIWYINCWVWINK